MTLTPPTITPEQIDAVRSEHAIRYADLASRGMLIGDDAEDHDFAAAILALNNTAWLEMLAGQESAKGLLAPWGWSIIDKRGVSQDTRTRVVDFFGAIQEREPFTPEDVAKTDQEFPGLAPHSLMAVYAQPAPVPAQAPAVAVPDDLPRIRAFAKSIFADGFTSVETYNDTVYNSSDEAFAKISDRELMHEWRAALLTAAQAGEGGVCDAQD
jgi:hypothetical protein